MREGVVGEPISLKFPLRLLGGPGYLQLIRKLEAG